jgi:hypothetical protein
VCVYTCIYVYRDVYKVWCISSGHIFSVMIQRTGGLVGFLD